MGSLTASVLVLFTLVSACLAQRELSFKLSLGVEGRREWNPWLLNDEEKRLDDASDVANALVLEPGLSARYSIDYARLGVSYSPKVTMYHGAGVERRTFKAHKGELSGDLYFTDRISLSIKDMVEDSVVGGERVSDEHNLDDRYFSNTVSESLECEVGTRLVFAVGHRSYGVWHERDNADIYDRDENSATARIGYKLGFRTEVGVSGQWGLISCKMPGRFDDRYEYSTTAYAKREVDQFNATVTLEGGVVTTEVKDDGDLGSGMKRRRDFTGALSIYKKTSLNSSASLEGSIGHRSSDAFAGEFSRTYALNASAEYLFFGRLETMMSGNVAFRKYVQTSERREWDYWVRTGIGYRLFEMVSLRASYTFAKVDSTHDIYEYDNHVLAVSVYLAYSLSS